jgi:hypothetical protein
LGIGVSIAEFLEVAIGLGKVFSKVSSVLGPVAVLLSVIDAKLSGCSRAASLAIFMFSLAAWVGILALGFYALPLLAIIMSVIAISVAQYLITSSIKEDYCGV